MPAHPADSTSRLAIVVSHPTQYYSPWFRHLAANLPNPIRVFYLWDFGVNPQRDSRFGTTFSWDVDLLTGYDSEFVPNTSDAPGTDSFKGLRNPLLLDRLSEWDPSTVLLFGYAYHSNLKLMLSARRRGWKLLFRGDSHLIDHARPRLAKRWLLRFLFRRIDTALYVGQANRAYFEFFGVLPERLRFCPHAVNGTWFEGVANDERKQKSRKAAGIPVDKHVFLFAGKFHPEKAPLELLETFLSLDLKDAVLVLAGDGELRETLISRAASAPERVRFLPFANQSEMPERYALADVFVLPSRGLYETWGLAVNEAMHAGCPSIVSHRVGCQQDLITPGETGWVFQAGDTASLRNALEDAHRTLQNTDEIARIRKNVRNRIENYTYAKATAALQAELSQA